MSNPKVSICIPYHTHLQVAFFLSRLLHSIDQQSFKDYEIILTKDGSMPVNSNAAIKKATGEIVKILYSDDYFAHPDALAKIVAAFDSDTTWLVTGCLHQRIGETPHSPHYPEYTQDIHRGNNRLGSPSVLAFRKEKGLLFDEKLSFLLDCDLYRRFYDLYGAPRILNDLNIIIGIGDHQVSNTMADAAKQAEFEYLERKYA